MTFKVIKLSPLFLVARWFGGEVTRPPRRQVRGLAIPSNEQGWVVGKVDDTIQWTNLYPVDSAIRFPNTYLLDNGYATGASWLLT